jgi:hypothetical protein
MPTADKPDQQALQTLVLFLLSALQILLSVSHVQIGTVQVQATEQNTCLVVSVLRKANEEDRKQRK